MFAQHALRQCAIRLESQGYCQVLGCANLVPRFSHSEILSLAVGKARHAANDGK